MLLCQHWLVIFIFVRYYHTTKKNLGDPGSSRGMFERIRVGLTVYVGCMYGTRLQMKEEIFFGWDQPSPIDIVNRNSGGKGSKKRSGIL